jgi:ABC-type transport system involved in cytochrome bd biosynthesis fused ATPase/permease subunit
MDLIKCALHYAQKVKEFYVTLFFYFLMDIVLYFVDAQLYYSLSQGNTTVMPYIVLITVAKPIMICLISRALDRIVSLKVSKMIFSENYNKYDKLTFESKNKLSAALFATRLFEYKNAITQIISWGIPEAFYLLGTISATVYTFLLMGLWFPLIMMATVSIIVYYFIVRPRQQKFYKFQKNIVDKNSKLAAIFSIMLLPFQYKEVSADRLVLLETSTISNNEKISDYFQKIMMITNSLNSIGTILIGFMMHGPAISFMLVFIQLTRLSAAVAGLTRFINQFERYNTGFKAFEKCWSSLTFGSEPDKLEIPQDLFITGVNIQFEGFTVRLADGVYVPIGKGTSTLIKGETGAGKTSFVNGLTGKIDGVTLSTGCPKNYYWLTADMYQKIREKLPDTDVSIRDYFRGELDDDCILEALRLCFTDNELKRLRTALETKEYVEDLENNIRKHTWLDGILEDGILSGGQKSRICLATRVCEMRNKQILVLDEPEQGSDRAMICWILNNVFRYIGPTKTIIMVTHMCDCAMEQLEINWTSKLTVKDGLITMI